MKWIGLALFIWSMFWGVELLCDKAQLQERIVRLHVVANSDSEEDQTMKLKVRDAIVAYLNTSLAEFQDIDQVKAYLAENLQTLENIARQVLESAGINECVNVSFEKETFPIRHYDTFSLPSGVYQSLRIRIGQAEGKNWWCVVFPTLCIHQTEDGFQEVAAGSGFSDGLASTLTHEEGYEVRFFLLDWLGQLENLLSDQ